MRIRHWRCWGWSSPASRHEGDGGGGDYEEHYGEDGDSGGDDGDVADDSGDCEVVIGNVAMFCVVIRMNLVNFNSLFFLVRPYNSPWSSKCMMVMLMIIDESMMMLVMTMVIPGLRVARFHSPWTPTTPWVCGTSNWGWDNDNDNEKDNDNYKDNYKDPHHSWSMWHLRVRPKVGWARYFTFCADWILSLLL